MQIEKATLRLLGISQHGAARHGAGASVGAVLIGAALIGGGGGLSGCHSYAPVTADTQEPRIRSVPGSGVAEWTPETGWKRPRSGDWGTPDHVRVESLRAFEAEKYADALAGFFVVSDRLPLDSAASVEADFYIAECSYYLGDYDTAIEHYRKVYKRGTVGDTMLTRTFEQVYAIALDYLYGKAGKWLMVWFLKVRGAGYGIDLLTSIEAGEEGLLTEFPYLDFADDALMEIARYHYTEQEDFDEAERVYRRVVLEYPYRDQRELAQFQLAMSIYRQIRGTAFEQEFMVSAERAFRGYLEDHPRGKNSEAAREKLRELTELQGDSYLEKAKFYLRDSQLVAARMYLRVVLERYTTTSAAREAQDIMAQIDRVEAQG